MPPPGEPAALAGRSAAASASTSRAICATSVGLARRTPARRAGAARARRRAARRRGRRRSRAGTPRSAARRRRSAGSSPIEIAARWPVARRRRRSRTPGTSSPARRARFAVGKPSVPPRASPDDDDALDLRRPAEQRAPPRSTSPAREQLRGSRVDETPSTSGTVRASKPSRSSSVEVAAPAAPEAEVRAGDDDLGADRAQHASRRTSSGSSCRELGRELDDERRPRRRPRRAARAAARASTSSSTP